MSFTLRDQVRARRIAVSRGEVRHVWPGAVWDVAVLAWFRRIWNPITAWWYGPSPNEVYHSPTGECPLCNPPLSPRGQERSK